MIGMACRLPGAPGPDAFWDLLRDGHDAITEAPAGRYDRLGTDEAAPARGGFLPDVAGFDAGFFGISPREAVAMDPQQRLMLELAWEALEDAFVVPARLRGSGTGVFVGAMADDYAQLTHARGAAAVTAHTLPGVHRGVIANRISHLLGLGGPSLTVDTGQSSGLAAVHLACAALRNGEAGLALAGAVHLNLAPGSLLATMRFGALSPDGRCHTFDARADGYVRGEGAALVVLKPLARALADGDRVHCVVLGSAMNSDDGPDPLTVPGRRAQEAVLRRACATAGVAPARVQYVELHGTGTRVGDPVEAAALGAVHGAGRGPGDALRVGSAKTNVGHLEGAAGLVGLLKTALCIRHRRLVPSLNFTAPHAAVPLADLGLRVQTALTGWPRPDEPPLAGVSSFGMGGTNCHVVLAAPPEAVPGGSRERAATATTPGEPFLGGPGKEAVPGAPVPWLLSARTAPALRAQARALAAHLRRPGTEPADAARTLATARAHHEHRAVLPATDGRPPLAALDALAEGRPDPAVIRGRAQEDAALAVLFTGQGVHWPGSGRGLYTAFPAFAEALDEICEHLDPYLDRPLHDLLFHTPDADGLARRTDYAQCALFAVETALLRLLESWGVRPSVLAGHSVGELVAAHAAGVLSLPDAAALVSARGRLMHGAPGEGAMLAVRASPAEVRAALPPGAVDVAAINAPESVVVSGAADAVERVAAHWAARGRRTRRLRVGHAFHSPLMDPILEEFRGVAAGLDYHPPRIPVVSNVTGTLATAEQLCSPDYWTRHVRATVRFADAVRTLDAYGTGAYLEVGPEPALTVQAARCLPPADPDGAPAPLLTATLRPGHDEPTALLTTVSRLHAAGRHIDWSALLAPGPRADLPTYRFQRHPHWLPPAPRTDRPLGTPGPPAATAPVLATPAPTTPAPTTPASTAAAETPAAETPAGIGPVAGPEELADQPYWHRVLAGRVGRERYRSALGLVRAEAAAVLGHPGEAAIDPHRSFRDAGFDSVTAVEYRDRLRELTGLPLPVSLVFDRPTPAGLTEYLLSELTRPGPEPASAVPAALDRLRTALSEEPPDPANGERLVRELRALLSVLPGTRSAHVPDDVNDLTEQIGTATDDEIFALLDREFDA